MVNNLRIIFYHYKCTGIIILKCFRQILFNNLINVFFSSYFFLASTRNWWLPSFWHQIFIGSFFLLGTSFFLVASFFLASNLYWCLPSLKEIEFERVFVFLPTSNVSSVACRFSSSIVIPWRVSQAGKVKRNKTINVIALGHTQTDNIKRMITITILVIH